MYNSKRGKSDYRKKTSGYLLGRMAIKEASEVREMFISWSEC